MQLIAQQLPAAAQVAGLVVTVLIAAWTDLREWRIPNRLLAASAAAALMLSVFAPGGQGLIAALLGGLVGLTVFMPLYLLAGMAAGDVKLMAVVGLYSGAAMTLDIALLTALIGGAWVIASFQWEMHRPESTQSALSRWGACLRHRTRRVTRREDQTALHNKRLLIPYGAVIAVGTFLALFIAGH